MKRKLGWALFVGGVLVLMVLATGSRGLDPGPSVYSKRPGGWMLARHYLEARGTEVRVATRSLETVSLVGSAAGSPAEGGPAEGGPAEGGPAEGGPAEGGRASEGAGVLALAFPWQRPASEQELMAIDRHLRRGGTVLVAVSSAQPGLLEERVLDRLGLSRVRLFDRPPVWLPEWWRLRREGRTLASTADDRPALTLDHGAIWGVVAPPGAQIYYRAVPEPGGPPNGVPLVFETRYQGGRVVVLPAELLANGRLASTEQGAAHGALLESLRLGLGSGPESTWHFDEYHLGLGDRTAEGGPSQARHWDLFAAHLLLLYVLGIVALARGFGPVFVRRTVRSGSAGTFLRGLGALHHRLGHHGAAARRLVERSRRAVPAELWDETFDRRAAGVRDGAGLLALARDIADHQERRRS